MPPPKLPPNWPRDQSIAFIEDCVYSRNLKPEVLADVAPQLGKATPQSSASGCNRVVRIKPVDDPKHPAHGQYGLFSATKLQPRSHVIDYLGFVHNDAESDETSNYDLRLADGVGVDASMMGNEARFLNDYRGVAQRPNVEFQTRRVKVTQQLRMAVFVGKWEIPKGQELLVSYGKGFWSARRERDVHQH